MMNIKRRHQLIIVSKTIFSPEPRCFSYVYFIKAIDRIFYGFPGFINPLGRWEKARKACKSRAAGE